MTTRRKHARRRRLINRALRRYRAAGYQRSSPGFVERERDPLVFTPVAQRLWSQFFALGDPFADLAIAKPINMHGDAVAVRRNFNTGRRAVLQWAREWARR